MIHTVQNLVTSLADARAQRAEQRRLRAELASYSSPAERAELDAIIDRQTPEARALLAQQAGLRSVA